MYWPKEPYDPNKKKHEIKYAFKIGDRVRTTFLRKPFQREYVTGWTGEIFKITRRFMRQGQPIYVSLCLCVQNQRKKWNFPLNFRTMRKLSDLYSGIFQTQSSGCASGVDLFRNFTKLKILNI